MTDKSSTTELDEAFLSSYDMVIASRLPMSEASRISKATLAGGGKFYLVDCFGWNGACVMDLGDKHVYRAEVGKALSDEKTLESHIALEHVWDIPLQDLTSRVDKKHPPLVWLEYRANLEYVKVTGEWPSKENADKYVQVVQDWISNSTSPEYKELEFCKKENLIKWASVATAEVSPVCAILGGILGNEVIKAISSKGEPANNALILEGATGKCRNVLLMPAKK